VAIIDGNFACNLALAIMASAGLALYQPSAAAQNAPAKQITTGKQAAVEKEKEEDQDESDTAKKGAVALDEKEEKKLDEKEEKEEIAAGWRFGGTVNRALIFWNDGKNSGRNGWRGARFVDNDQDGGGLEVERKFQLENGWTMAPKVGFDISLIPSGSVSQTTSTGNGLVVALSDAVVEFDNKKWGNIAVGQGDSASNNANSLNLAYSNVLADAEVENWNNDFFLRSADNRLTRAKWGDFVHGTITGGTGMFVVLGTPKIMGFEGKVGVGQPNDIVLTGQPTMFKSHGLFTDAGIVYNRTWDRTFRVLAGVGVWNDTTEEPGAEEPTNNFGWGSSFAIRHIPTGLNVAVNYGWEKHTNQCAEPGEVTGRCRGEDQMLYFKGGIVRDFFEWGPTSIYGEYFNGWKKPNESDQDILRAFELNPDTAEELQRTIGTVWGFGVVQYIKPAGTRTFTTSLYAGYRHYSLDLNLIGADGRIVPSQKVNDISMIMVGMRMKWGEGKRAGRVLEE
jgi:hypothetical protein